MANYKYWEGFIHDWHCGVKPIAGWTNPDLIPLYGDGTTLSSTFIPEPWWGNDGCSPLHSVVINFNPGKGYNDLLKSNVPYKTSYANDIVKGKKLPINDQWHQKNRANPILSALELLGYKKVPHFLKEHLSVELIPWRTPSVNKNYKTYLQQNIREVYYNSICFAAQESHRIINKKLKDVVILRMNEYNTKSLLNQLKTIKIASKLGKRGSSISGKGKYAEFSINRIPNVRFISIWGPKSRNNFTPMTDLIEIINLI